MMFTKAQLFTAAALVASASTVIAGPLATDATEIEARGYLGDEVSELDARAFGDDLVDLEARGRRVKSKFRHRLTNGLGRVGGDVAGQVAGQGINHALNSRALEDILDAVEARGYRTGGVGRRITRVVGKHRHRRPHIQIPEPGAAPVAARELADDVEELMAREATAQAATSTSTPATTEHKKSHKKHRTSGRKTRHSRLSTGRHNSHKKHQHSGGDVEKHATKKHNRVVKHSSTGTESTPKTHKPQEKVVSKVPSEGSKKLSTRELEEELEEILARELEWFDDLD
jgi:hypothetical protein